MEHPDPEEAMQDASSAPSLPPRRMPPRRSSAHVHPPDWLPWLKQSPSARSRRFSLRKHSWQSTKSNEDGDSAQTNVVPGFDATYSVPLSNLSGPGSPTIAPITAFSSTPPKRRHSTAWHFIHSIVSNSSSVSSPSASTDTASQPSSSPPDFDSPLPAMAQQVGQGTPVQDISAALPGEIVALPESSHITPTESPAPPSAHDVVVNNLLKRPIIHRSNSTPVPAPASGLDIPRRLSGTLTPNEPDRVHVQAPTEAVRESSLSALLRGPLDASGGGVTRALGSHIEAVLSAQEEIGRAHLALEGIGALKPARLDLVNSPPEQGQAAAERAAEDDDPDEADLLRRQQGVEELMAKLSELAASIKSYHDIGTPALIFPQTGLPKPRHRLAPPLTEPKTGKRAATIANPDMAHDEPELPPPAPMAAPAPVTVGRRGMQSWFRKNKPIADSPTELSPIERDTEGKSKRPW